MKINGHENKQILNFQQFIQYPRKGNLSEWLLCSEGAVAIQAQSIRSVAIQAQVESMFVYLSGKRSSFI